MKNNMYVMLAALVMLAVNVPVHPQVQPVEDITEPTPQFQDHGGVTPWFWIGVQTVFSAGYNIETTAAGFRNYGGDNYSYASFNLAFVDSRHQTSKFYEVPGELDPDAWTGHFVMLNFTSRINSWDNGSTGVENNAPAWLAEITGKGMRIGFFTQAANLVGGIYDEERTSATSANPITRISGGNKVLNLRENQLGTLFYEKANDPVVTTTYLAGSEGAVWYVGYEKRELFNTYLTMLSEGNVNSDVSDGRKKGLSGVVDFGFSPLGLFTDDETPITFNVTGNVIAGFNWKNTTENTGFGLRGEAGFWLGRGNLVLSPIAAFDGKINSSNDFSYKVGGGFIFRFSGMRWINDEWGDLYSFSGSAGNFANYRYENSKILKYAYVQIYGATVPDPADSGNSDFNLLFRAEEPDGNAGFHEKLGAMGEFRLYNTLKRNNSDLKWESQARISWDFNIKEYLVIPYLRGYLNDDSVVKIRLGAYANIIPFTGFEIAYTSANLNKGVTLPKPAYLNASYGSYYDSGRIEFLVILKSDDSRPQVPKRMSDWNYPAVIQDN